MVADLRLLSGKRERALSGRGSSPRLFAPHSHYHYPPAISAEDGMYDYVDRPVERLGNGSRFVLWAMRAWVNAARRDRCGRAAVGGSFVNMGAAAALPDFHAAMARLRRAPGMSVTFAPMGCPRIAEGEAVLLALWADLARDRADRALAVLRLMVPAATADLLRESMAAATDHLCHARLAPDGLTTLTSSDTGGDE